MSPTARRRTRYLVLAAAVVVQLVVLYVPRVPEVGAVAVPGGDKIVHATVFAAVTLAGLRAGLSPAVVAVFGVAHAGVSELLQHTVLPARSGDPFDVLADLAGVALGALAAWWLAGRESRPDDVRDGAPGRSGRGRPGPWR
ncbi:VanZ family protein [Georgenia sp. EYE_87]|uniref:VanZ family protein n=1 Tax=Georgenia sp. EYE_87 TaxID=2853448 RepID=UPI0020039A0C|nr:VanZ family protein [Georgenia sp. EYE_87]MCK6212655.1 VanZ family protein [Georgenia sp. EYE_87]